MTKRGTCFSSLSLSVAMGNQKQMRCIYCAVEFLCLLNVLSRQEISYTQNIIRFHSESQIKSARYGVTLSGISRKLFIKIKLWTNGPTSWICVETCVGWPNRCASFLASKPKSQTKSILRYTYPEFHWLIGYYNNDWKLFNLCLSGQGGQTVKDLRRLAWNGISTKVSAIHRKSTQNKTKYLKQNFSTSVDLRICLGRA